MLVFPLVNFCKEGGAQKGYKQQWNWIYYKSYVYNSQLYRLMNYIIIQLAMQSGLQLYNLAPPNYVLGAYIDHNPNVIARFPIATSNVRVVAIFTLKSIKLTYIYIAFCFRTGLYSFLCRLISTMRRHQVRIFFPKAPTCP